MNYKKILFVLLFTIYYSYSQSEFKVIYNFYNKSKNVNYELIYKNGISKYVTHQKKETVRFDNFQVDFNFSHIEYFYDVSKKKFYQFRILEDEKTSIVSEWKNDMKWKITNETKKIGEYTVQKAESDYLLKYFPSYGKIIAWFTYEIPVEIGPENYKGLPGLIMEIGYEGGTDKIVFKSIEFKSQEDIVINKNGIPVDKEKMIRPLTINKKWLKKQAQKLK